MKKLLLIALIAVVAIAGFVFFRGSSGIVNYKDQNLTAEQKAAFEAQVAEAKEALEKATAENEKFSAYMKMGFSYSGLGEYGKAKRAFQSAIEFAPGNPNPYVALYDLGINMTDYKGALASIEKALELAPQFPANWNRLATVKAEFLNATEAEVMDVYSEALRVATPTTEIHVSMARYFESIDDLEKALIHWELAQAEESNNKALYEQEANRVRALMAKPAQP